jgi:hypothetical protein
MFLLRVITPKSDRFEPTAHYRLPTIRALATKTRNQLSICRTEIFQVYPLDQPPAYALKFVEGVNKGYDPRGLENV